MSMTSSSRLVDMGLKFSRLLPDARDYEYRQALRFLSDCERILDVGCGTGTFLELASASSVGIDINPENVVHCTGKGLNARTGNALAIPFQDSSFDGVHCSHVLQVFGPEQALTCLCELARVTRPNGVVVLTTLNWFKRFFRHPENVRPYPPDSIRSLLHTTRRGASSPMFVATPDMSQEAVWLRHPPLLELWSAKSHNLDRVAGLSNRLQRALLLRKYWSFDAYVMKLRVNKSTGRG